jgi:hypothetical protein
MYGYPSRTTEMVPGGEERGRTEGKKIADI